ncbi:MAG: hypothetical protein HKN46_05000 [Acidimicrobiia bacterium]|nr:hypothetical protein [Acidimicrobiia bacterium]
MDAAALLDEALVVVDKLDRLCCEPGRSPRMAELRRTIVEAREASGDPIEVGELLEQAGAQVGSLQVGCCAEGRLPLYAEVLAGLARAQLATGPDMHA